MTKLVIYHYPCADGFTAAWVAWKALGPDTEFYRGLHGEPPPDVEGKDVYILDFSYKRPIMEQLVKKARNLVHIDHHISAINDMAGFEADNFNTFYSINNTQSGAMLAWHYFFPMDRVPNIVKYVDDVDRWKFLLPNSADIQANMFSYDYTFENWEFLHGQPFDHQLEDGMAILRRLEKDCNEIRLTATRRMNIAGYNVPVCNCPKQFGSYIASDLAVEEPFAAYYYDTHQREFGLRSSPDGLDVSKIAEIYGGGGHKTASGFKVSFTQAQEFEE